MLDRDNRLLSAIRRARYNPAMTHAEKSWRTTGGRFAFAALIAGALGIAFSPIFVRLSDLGAPVTAFWRPALAIPVLLIWVAFDQGGRSQQKRAPTPRDYALLVLSGFMFAGDLFCWHWSIQFTSIANSTLLANFAPIFVTLASWLLFGERFTLQFLIALGLGIAGAIVLMGDSLTISPDNLIGDAISLVTAMFYGGYIIVVGRLRARFSTATIMSWSSVVTAVFLLPIALHYDGPLLATTLFGWGVLLGLGLVSHAGGQSLIAYALAHLPAAFSSLSLLVQPVASTILAWIVLGEAIGIWQGLGGAIVLSGILLARRGSAAATKPPPPEPTAPIG